MVKYIGVCLTVCGVMFLLVGVASALNCIPGETVGPARCVDGGEEPLVENAAFPNCFNPEGTMMCKPVEPLSACGQFNGYGQPRNGRCQYALLGSNPKTCREGVGKIEITLNYWVGGCDWRAEDGQCACVFIADGSVSQATTVVCNCREY